MLGENYAVGLLEFDRLNVLERRPAVSCSSHFPMTSIIDFGDEIVLVDDELELFDRECRR